MVRNGGRLGARLGIGLAHAVPLQSGTEIGRGGLESSSHESPWRRVSAAKGGSREEREQEVEFWLLHESDGTRVAGG
jgi:hypothetical protein